MRPVSIRRRVTGIVLGAALCVAATAATAAGQAPEPRGPRRAAAAAPAPYTVAQVQQMFDAYTLMQAQRALALDQAQNQAFVSKLRALQQLRRRHLQARRQIVQALAKLTASQAAGHDEAQIRRRLQALADLDVSSAAEIRAAYDAIDQVLDTRQQARFRVLEEQTERLKFDLLARARRAGAAGPPVK